MKERIVLSYESLPSKFGIVVDGDKQLGEDLCRFFKDSYGIEWQRGGIGTTDPNARDHIYEVMLVTKPQGNLNAFLTYGSLEYVNSAGYPLIDVSRKVVIEFSESRIVVEYNGVKYDRDEFLKALEGVKKFN